MRSRAAEVSRVHGFPHRRRDTAKGGPLALVSRAVGSVRFLFMPLGLFSLLAVGLHAAADAVDDRLLWALDGLDAAFDAWAGGRDWSAGWVNLVDLDSRTRIARGLALVWELLALAILGLPLLNYGEGEDAPAARPWRTVFADVLRRPTILRLTRAPFTFALGLAGACTLARSVQGTVFLRGDALLGAEWAEPAARVAAVALLLAVLWTFALRASLFALVRADDLARAAGKGTARDRARAALRGLPGTAVVLPLAAAALLDASPLLSFFR